MKLNEIKCVLTTEERLNLVDYIIEAITKGHSHYTCPCIYTYLIKNDILLDRAADSLGISRGNMERILLGGVNLYPITERHKVKGRMYLGGTECIEERDFTYANIEQRLFFPELLEYEPKILALGGGFWKASRKSIDDPRLKALREIRTELSKLSKEETCSQENQPKEEQ